MVSHRQVLLEAGAEVDAFNSDKETALHYASYYGYPDVAKVKQASSCGLRHAVQCFQLLLSDGANVQAASETGMTALIFAAWQGYEGIAQVCRCGIGGCNLAETIHAVLRRSCQTMLRWMQENASNRQRFITLLTMVISKLSR